MGSDSVGPRSPLWLRELAPHSAAGAFVAGHDWSETALGEPNKWSENLKSAVRVCISESAPALLVWGPDLVQICNDSFSEIFVESGNLGVLGVPMENSWTDDWEQLQPLLQGMLRAEGPAEERFVRYSQDAEESGEEHWFELTFSRVADDDGTTGGLLAIASEVTSRILTERQLICLRDLASELVSASDMGDVCVRAARVLSHRPRSVRWAELYLRANDELVKVSSTLTRRPVPAPMDKIRAVFASGVAEVHHGSESSPDRPPFSYIAPLITEASSSTSESYGREGTNSTIGVFVAGLTQNRPFDHTYRVFIDLCAGTISAALTAARVRADELGVQREIGTTLQRAMLQPATDSPTVAARYVPASGHLVVGGDWYDVIDLGDGRAALTVGDCVGHNLEAAAVMGQLRSASRALLIEGNSPARVLHAMDLFAAAIDGLASTMVCAIVDTPRMKIVYSSAGHPPGLIVGREGSRWLDGGRGTPLGVRFESRPESTDVIDDADLIAFFSDGLIERRREPLDVGLERLRINATANWAKPVQEFADELLVEMSAERSSDDVVLVAMRVHQT